MNSGNQSQSLITHSDVAAFADQKINLKNEDLDTYRKQVGSLRAKVESFINENPDYGLVKMLLSGSLAKGTALSSLNDIDVAVYVDSNVAPWEELELLDWLSNRLREAYPQMSPDQIQPMTHVIRISYRGTGLDLDVLPVYFEGGGDDMGYIVDRHSGKRVLTSIPLHLQFIRRRKEKQNRHYAQLIRLVKWWGRQRRNRDTEFRFRSFLVELVCAHIVDSGVAPSPYPDALEDFFAYIVKSELSERIVFQDYYTAERIPNSDRDPIEVFDPVNPENNVAADYTDSERRKIVDAAEEALDLLAEARFSNTRGRAIECWRGIVGPAFLR